MKDFLHTAKSFLVATMLATGIFAYAEDSRVTINPTPGVVTELSEFLLTFDGEWGLGSKRSAKITISGPEGATLPKIQNYSLGADTGYLLYFEDDAIITAPGDYAITIPSGKFAIDNVDLDEMVFNYTIEGVNPEDLYQGEVLVDPEPGTYEYLDLFLFLFEDEVEIANASGITLNGPDGPVNLYTECDEEFLQVLVDNDDYMATECGEYTLRFALGSILIGGKACPVMEYNYVVENDYSPFTDLPSYAISPAPGEYTTINEGFRLTFDTEEGVEIDPNWVFLNGPEGDIPVVVDIPRGMSFANIFPVEEDGSVMKLTTAGDYTLVFTMGAIVIGDASNNEPLVFEYTVTGQPSGEWDYSYTATPASGSVVESLSSIDIVFNGAATVAISDTARPNEFPAVYDANNNLVAYTIAFAEHNSLSIMMRSEITDNGEYTVVVPRNFITIDGIHPSADITLSYSIENEVVAIEYTYTMDPEAGVFTNANQVFSITFAGDDVAEVLNNPYAWGKDFPHFTNEMNAYNPNLQVAQNGFTFSFSHTWPFEETGKYTLVIPAGYFTVVNANGDEMKVAEICVDYILQSSGINSIESDGSNSEIFTISGVRVNGNSLPAGIYIINGKKAIVK